MMLLVRYFLRNYPVLGCTFFLFLVACSGLVHTVDDAGDAQVQDGHEEELTPDAAQSDGDLFDGGGDTGDGMGDEQQQPPYRPFPQHVQYTAGCIRPSHKSQEQLDEGLENFYDYWKAQYLKTSSNRGYYIEFESPCVSKTTVSEAHGFGMIVVVLMAGYDPDAQEYFDGMLDFYDDHRSNINDNLMDWEVDCDETPGGDDDCATDGDMDIAYALLLAHNQWGSGGQRDYLSEARRIISSGIKPSLVGDGTYNLMLGDWDNDPWSTRSSDWMADHCRAFGLATSDLPFWNEVVERIYTNIGHIQTEHSPATGLMPDFVVNATIDPASAGFLEGPHDGDYYYNACRWPWRTALDYAQYGEIRAKDSVNALINWIETSSGGDPENIMAGYSLDGNAFANWNDLAFTAPIAAGAMLDSSHQAFLNTLWDYISTHTDSYYPDSINILCQIFISGNWWKPEP